MLLLALSAALAQAPRVFDFDAPVSSTGLPSAWEFKRWWPVVGVGDYRASARLVDGSSVGLPGHRALQVDSADSGLMVGTQTHLDISATPMATWTWRAEALPTGGSFRSRDTNDQALQILFAFEGGHVLGYIWDTTNPVGASGSGLAWREDVRVLVVQSGAAELGRAVREQRDLLADYQALFGGPPPALVGVAVQSNSQHTESHALGTVGPITLSAR